MGRPLFEGFCHEDFMGKGPEAAEPGSDGADWPSIPRSRCRPTTRAASTSCSLPRRAFCRVIRWHHVTVCTTADFTLSVDALLHFTFPEDAVFEVRYMSACFHITDGCAMMYSALVLCATVHSGLGYVGNCKLYDLYFPPACLFLR